MADDTAAGDPVTSDPVTSDPVTSDPVTSDPLANKTGASLSLKRQIILQIQTQGPMSLATYMRLCLTHPSYGYYKTVLPLGEKGDFVTAPEISQLFGEMLGAWVLMQWHILNRPTKFELVELGPGRGTLLADIMRLVSLDKDALAATNITLLETSLPLIKQQRDTLKNYSSRWISEIDQLDEVNCPLIIVANEFFDALPIKQFQFQNGVWFERLIGMNGEDLTWGLSTVPMPARIVPTTINAPEQGAIWETSHLAAQTISALANILNQRSGAMMVLDYGHQHSKTGPSFQAISRHKFADPIANPGEADLSAHVDFETLILAAREQGAEAVFVGSQSQVLNELGIGARAEQLIKTNPEKAKAIKTDLNRLIGDDQMGELFKAMTITGKSSAPPRKLDRELSRHSRIKHGFFGRHGGCSTGSFSSLNTSLSTKDDTNNVARNRQTIMKAFALPLGNLVTLSQIHSAKVITIDNDYDLSSRPEADGMVTSLPTLALGILTADCAPVLLADPEAGVIAACHAGWKGAIAGIIGNTITAMENIGAKRERIIAALGPTINVQNYEVGPEFAQNFLKLHPEGDRFIVKLERGGREHFDLPAFVLSELNRSGIVRPSQVGLCTFGHADKYFSHRYAVRHQQISGRQISIIAQN